MSIQNDKIFVIYSMELFSVKSGSMKKRWSSSSNDKAGLQHSVYTCALHLKLLI
jgi:hypothetical protein